MTSVLFSTVVDSFHFRAVWILSTRRLIVVIVVVIIVITVIVSSFLLLSAVVDSFRFGAMWILSTGRLSVVRFRAWLLAAAWGRSQAFDWREH